MKVVFFGTPLFAARILSHLVEAKVEIVAVVSKPDKAQGRSSRLIPTAVKEVALNFRLPLFQPEKASDPEFAKTLQKFNADLFIVVAYGEIMKEHLLQMPKMACINIHASLLPKYRGAAPIHRCLMAGEKETGITIMHMVRQMDAGDIILQKRMEIGPNMTVGELTDALCALGCEAISETLALAELGKLPAKPQDPLKVTMAPKIELEECQVIWERSAAEIHNLIRGANPAPGAWCEVLMRGETRRMKLWKSQIVEGNGSPGELLALGKGRLIVACGEKALELTEVQMEGKKKMDSKTFILGTAEQDFKIKPRTDSSIK